MRHGYAGNVGFFPPTDARLAPPTRSGVACARNGKLASDSRLRATGFGLQATGSRLRAAGSRLRATEKLQRTARGGSDTERCSARPLFSQTSDRRRPRMGGAGTPDAGGLLVADWKVGRLKIEGQKIGRFKVGKLKIGDWRSEPSNLPTLQPFWTRSDR